MPPFDLGDKIHWRPSHFIPVEWAFSLRKNLGLIDFKKISKIF